MIKFSCEEKSCNVAEDTCNTEEDGCNIAEKRCNTDGIARNPEAKSCNVAGISFGLAAIIFKPADNAGITSD